MLQSSPIQTFFNSEYKGTNHVFLTAEPVSECTNDINHINLNKYVCKIWVKKIERIILKVNKMLPVYRMVQLDQMPFVYLK